MFPSGYSSRHRNRQSMQDRSSLQSGVSSSARSSRTQQTPHREGYANRTADLRDTISYDSELGHLLAPPSPPPSLDQIFSREPSSSSSQQPIATPNSHNHYQNIYDDIERELFAEPSSSSPQPNTGAVPPLHSNSRYQSLYDGFAQALSTAPTSSRQQSAASESASTTSETHSHYPGVSYNVFTGKWLARWVDPSQGHQRIFIGNFDTQSEAKKALNAYKASRSKFLPQVTPAGLYRSSTGKWVARYRNDRIRTYVGTFDTKEEAEKALREHRAKRGLPLAMSSRRRRQ